MAAKIQQPIRLKIEQLRANLSPTPIYAISRVIMWQPCLICQARTGHLPNCNHILSGEAFDTNLIHVILQWLTIRQDIIC